MAPMSEQASAPFLVFLGMVLISCYLFDRLPRSNRSLRHDPPVYVPTRVMDMPTNRAMQEAPPPPAMTTPSLAAALPSGDLLRDIRTIEAHVAALRQYEPGISESLQAYPWAGGEDLFSPDIIEEVQRMTFQGSDPNQGLLFVGYFSKAEDVAMREMIRQTSLKLVPQGVTVRFVLCHRQSHGPSGPLWAELHAHQDLFFLECDENSNEGKSIDYWQHVMQHFPNYHYYAKADTDAYILFHNLARAVDAAPRCRVYMGRSNAESGKKNFNMVYMSGALYVLSKDVVLRLQECGERCVDRSRQPEDLMIARLVWSLTNQQLHFIELHRTDGDLYPYYEEMKPFGVRVDPTCVSAHFAKGLDLWWDLHKHYIKILTVENVRASVDFLDGPDTQMLTDTSCPPP